MNLAKLTVVFLLSVILTLSSSYAAPAAQGFHTKKDSSFSVTNQKKSSKSSSTKKTKTVVLRTVKDVSTRNKETIFTIMSSQGGVTWGLDRVDGTVDSTFTYGSDGKNIKIYVVDTGVDANHPELRGRVLDGYDSFGQNLDQTDCNGHGTHVAGIVAGTYFGAAKAASIVPVRVLDCSGRGNTTTLAGGIDWILANHPGGPGVVNMSLGGSLDLEVNALASKLVSAGLVVVAAAGNSNMDACSFSPASAPGVIAVGAVDRNDVKASFSNWGDCVDIFAPGVGINSANSLDYGISSRRSGTSQAAPFVAGAIATYYSKGSATSISSVNNRLKNLSVRGVVTVEPYAQEVVAPEPSMAPTPSPEVVQEPAPTPEPEKPEYWVEASQESPGSPFGTLRWSRVEGAVAYKIYRTSSIRPSWILYGYRQQNLITEAGITGLPGSTARYRIFAVINSEEVLVGETRYKPTS